MMPAPGKSIGAAVDGRQKKKRKKGKEGVSYGFQQGSR
jgi:hypothetical protein